MPVHQVRVMGGGIRSRILSKTRDVMTCTMRCMFGCRVNVRIVVRGTSSIASSSKDSIEFERTLWKPSSFVLRIP